MALRQQKSGAGAAVSSGADYQARVAAHLLVASLCDSDSIIVRGRRLSGIDFETTLGIDDLNVSFEGGDVAYIQAKRSITFSLTKGSALTSFLVQSTDVFSDNPEAECWLVATSASSKRITNDLRIALDNFRESNWEKFRRDQPESIVSALDDIAQSLRASNAANPDGILRRMRVGVVDAVNDGPLEQSEILILNARGYASPRLIHGHLIAKCVDLAARRGSVSSTSIKSEYEKFQQPANVIERESVNELLSVEFGNMEFSVGKEVYLGDVSFDGKSTGKVGFLEFYRFDDSCSPRVPLSEGICTLDNGLSVAVERRAATQDGMIRVMERTPLLMEDRELLVFESSLSDYDIGLCADVHRQKLEAAIRKNTDLLRCLHCSRHVGSEASELVEVDSGEEPVVGFVHTACLTWKYRVLGAPTSDFFSTYPHLVGFDANGWYQSIIRGGQDGIQQAASLRNPDAVMTWSGRSVRSDEGDWVLQFTLANGDIEYAYHRGQADRHRKDSIEEFSNRMNKWVELANLDGDPLVSSDQSKSFGSRSLILSQLGSSEALREVVSAKPVKFTREIGDAYNFSNNWFAPLTYLNIRETDEPFCINECVVVISDPLKLDRFIANWRDCSIWLPPYRIDCLLDDTKFDIFARSTFDSGRDILVDPLLSGFGGQDLVSGNLMRSLEVMSQEVMEEERL